MIVNGVDCKLLYGYSATREFKVVEQTTTSNKKFYLDYGYTSDDVTASFTLMFLAQSSSDMIDMESVNDSLIQGSLVTLLGGVEETIFGSEIDYSSSLTAHIVSVGKPSRVAYERYELPVVAVIKNPTRDTSISTGSINSLLIPLNYTYGYAEERSIFSGTSDISSMYSYTGSNSIAFGSFNKATSNAPIKSYLAYTLRTGQATIPDDWKTYTKAFEQFDLTYMKMTPILKETFNKHSMSILDVEFIGVNK